MRESRTLLLILTVNALDLSTSAVPWYWDSFVPLPPRAGWLVLCQWALLLPWAYGAWPWIARLRRRLGALAMPRPAAYVLSAVLFLQFVHIAFRMEHYPFSLVGMFSALRPKLRDDRVLLHRVAFERDGNYELVSVMREGNPYFRKYLPDVDYKMAWFYLIYAKQFPRIHEDLALRLKKQGLPAPIIVVAEYRLSDGAVLGIEPLYTLGDRLPGSRPE